jgi:hypothetical protein
MAFGDPESQAGHPALLAHGRTIHLAWKEFDGTQGRIRVMSSTDDGVGWSAASTLATAAGGSDLPQLVNDGDSVFLSWNTQRQGYRLIPLDAPGATL